MPKIGKKVIIIITILIIFIIPFKSFAQNLNEEYDDLDYVWLEEEIKNAKEQVEPNINSKYAVIFDRSSKTVIFGKNEQTKVPMASTTKIMTAIILLENVSNISKKVEVSKQAASIGGSRLGLKTGDIITYNDLLYGLMLCSGNDAATQIAISVGGNIQGFADMMNKKAKDMGLQNSNFVTPHGLDNEKHYTTALELAKITDYALNIEKFAQVVETQNYIVTINGYPKTIRNTNELLGNLKGVNGVKTGFTNGAGRCLVTSVLRDNFNIITVVLGADTKKLRTSDSIKLIEYTYKNYELVDLKKLIEKEFENWNRVNQKRIKVYKGQDCYLQLELGPLKYNKYPVLKENLGNINVKINSNFQVEAPIKEKTIIGNIKVKLNTTEIEDIDILNTKKIERKTVIFYVKELILLYKWNINKI